LWFYLLAASGALCYLELTDKTVGGIFCMDEVEKSVNSVSLPLVLPEAAFVLFGKERRIPDFDLIIKSLPVEVRTLLDPNATASGGGQSTYLLPLMDGRHLKIRIESHSIIELAVVKQ
jgi:hypothetical protein